MADMRVVSVEWSRRTRSEYQSSAFAMQVTLWLTELGASPDLIRDGLRIAGEELAHAERCFAVCTATGHGDPPAIGQTELRFLETSDRRDDLLREVVRTFCLGETLAVSMFAEARRAARIPIVRETLDVIVRDEVGHRQFGWDVLDWIMETASDVDVANRVAGLARPMIADFCELYARLPDTEPVGWREREWGLTPTAVARDLVVRAAQRDWPRRFARHGIELVGIP